MVCLSPSHYGPRMNLSVRKERCHSSVARQTIGLAMALAICLVSAPASGLPKPHPSVASRKMDVAGLHVVAWIPNPNTRGPWPIIIFSHGYYGCNTQLSFLMQEIAAAGYAIFAPAHR